MDQPVRVNIGCGMSPTPGWLNFDNSWSVRLARTPLGSILGGRAAYVESVRRNNVHFAQAQHLPIADGGARIVYSSHMLEHLDRQGARDFLQEAKRVLAPRGRIRIVVPDLAKLIDGYARSSDADAFVEQLAMSRSQEPTLRARLAEVITGFRAHHWMYDSRSLVQLLEAAGFVDVAALPAGQTRIDDVGELDLHERDDESLYVEGTRP